MNSGWKDHIDSDPLILKGKPCIRGTRIPVALVLGYLAAKYSYQDILRELPDLSEGDIGAALEYARDLADFETAASA